MRTTKIVSVALSFVVFGYAAVAEAQDGKIQDRLDESATVFEALIDAPDSGIPKELLRDAECVAVIPAVKKVAFGFGGQYGRGVALCRRSEGTGPWGSPSMLALDGGSFGFQLGGSSMDVVMLFMTPESMRHLMGDNVKLGADATAAAGPKGRTAAAATNATMRAEILTYGRSRGLFAGVSLEGASLRPDHDANEELYGQRVDAEELLEQGTAGIPPAASRLVDLLTRASS